MRIGSVLAGIFAIGMAHGQAVVVARSGGYGLQSPYNQLYDRSRQVVFTGKVTGKVKGAPMRGMAEGMAVLIRTKAGTTEQVDVGPTWFVASQVAKINVGDSVKVIGSRVRLDGQNVVLARQIVNNKTKAVLALRDLAGAPYWAAVRPAIAEIPAGAIAGNIVSSGPVTIDGNELVGYVVSTPNGDVTVATAPQWFWDRQDVVLQPGAYIQVVGATRPLQIGNVTIANTLYTGNNSIILRNGGVPVWNGWGGF